MRERERRDSSPRRRGRSRSINRERLDSGHCSKSAYSGWGERKRSPDRRSRQLRSRSPPPSQRWNERKVVSVSPEGLKYRGDGRRSCLDLARNEQRRRSRDYGNRKQYSISPRRPTGRRGPSVSPVSSRRDRARNEQRRRSRDYGNRRQCSISPRRPTGQRGPSVSPRRDRALREVSSRFLDDNRKRKNPSPLPRSRGKSPPPNRSSRPPLHARDKESLYMASPHNPPGQPGRRRLPPSHYGRSMKRKEELSTTKDIKPLSSTKQHSTRVEKQSSAVPSGGETLTKESDGLKEGAGLEQDEGKQPQQNQALSVHDIGWGVVESRGNSDSSWGNTAAEKEDPPSSRQAKGDDDDKAGAADTVGNNDEPPSLTIGGGKELTSPNNSAVEQKERQIPPSSVTTNGSDSGVAVGDNGHLKEDGGAKKDEQRRTQQVVQPSSPSPPLTVNAAVSGVVELLGRNISSSSIDTGSKSMISGITNKGEAAAVLEGMTKEQNRDTAAIVRVDGLEGERSGVGIPSSTESEAVVVVSSCNKMGKIRRDDNTGATKGNVEGEECGDLEDGGDNRKQKNKRKLSLHDVGWGYVEAGGHNWGNNDISALEGGEKENRKKVLTKDEEERSSSEKNAKVKEVAVVPVTSEVGNNSPSSSSNHPTDSTTIEPPESKASLSCTSIGNRNKQGEEVSNKNGERQRGGGGGGVRTYDNKDINLLLSSSLSSKRKKQEPQNSKQISSGKGASTAAVSSLSTKKQPPLRSSRVKNERNGYKDDGPSVRSGIGRGRGAVLPSWMTSGTTSSSYVNDDKKKSDDSKSYVSNLKRRRSNSRDHSPSPRSRRSDGHNTASVQRQPPPREKVGCSSSTWGERPPRATLAPRDNPRNSNSAALGGGNEVVRRSNNKDYYSPGHEFSKKRKKKNENSFSSQSSKSENLVEDGRKETIAIERNVIKRGLPESTTPAWMSRMREEKSSISEVDLREPQADGSTVTSGGNTDDSTGLTDIMIRELDKVKEGLPSSWDVSISAVRTYIYIYIYMIHITRCCSLY